MAYNSSCCHCRHYAVVRKDRNIHGGGVAIIISKAVPFLLNYLKEREGQTIPWQQVGYFVMLCIQVTIWLLIFKMIWQWSVRMHCWVVISGYFFLVTSMQTLIYLTPSRPNFWFWFTWVSKSPTKVTASISSQLDLILTNCPSYFHTILLPFHVM